jgi:hypothetical protein
MNTIIEKLAEANDLTGVIDVADLNDPEKLANGTCWSAATAIDSWPSWTNTCRGGGRLGPN